MPKQAKLSLGLDIKPLLDKAKEAKRALETIGDVKFSSSVEGAFKKELLEDVNEQIKIYHNGIKETQAVMIGLVRVNKDAWNTSEMQAATRQLDRYTQGMRKALNVAKQLDQGSGGGGGGAAGAGGGGARGGGVRRMLSGGARAMGMMGIGFGVGAALGRATEQAEIGLQIRQLNSGVDSGLMQQRGGQTISGRSGYGFTRMERRQRALGISRARGGMSSGEDLNAAVGQGEMLERAFGITGQQQERYIGASRKSGGGGNMAGVVSDAINAGMTGGRIGEYLESMSSYLESMSQGIDIDQKSLRGFAGALGQLPFFESDPSRIFEALRGMEKTLQGGDQFSQFLSYAAISNAMPNAGPATIETRKRMGMFGKVDFGNSSLQGMQDELNSPDIFNSLLNTTMDLFSKKTEKTQFLAVADALNLTPGQAAPIFGEMKRQQEENPGGPIKFNAKDIADFQENMKSAEEIAAENMKSFSGSVKQFSEKTDHMKNAISDFITKGVMTFIPDVDKFSGAVKLFVAGLAMSGGIPGFGFGGRGGAGGAGGAGGMWGVGGGANKLAKGGMAIFAGFAAFEVGYTLGEGMVKILNQWTDGKFDKVLNNAIDRITGLSATDERNAEGVDVAGDMTYAAKEAGYLKRGQGEGGYFSNDELQTIPAGKKSLEAYAANRVKDEDKPFLDITNSDALDLQFGKDGFWSERAQNITRRILKRAAENRERHERSAENEGYGFGPNFQGFPEDALDMSQDGGLVPEGSGESFPVMGFEAGGEVSAARIIGNSFGPGDKPKPKPKPKPKKSGKSWWDRLFGGGTAAERYKKQNVISHAQGKGKARGGPVGSDTVAAWLTPGEYVNNRASTAKNIGALAYANAGGMIGPVGSGGGDGGGGYMMPNIDFIPLELAMNANTSAVRNLTEAISGLLYSSGRSRTFNPNELNYRISTGNNS